MRANAIRETEFSRGLDDPRTAPMSASPAEAAPLVRGRDGSPVHDMQARIEAAVFASFVAKEKSGTPRMPYARVGLWILAASAGGYGVFSVAGLLLHFY